MQGVICKIGFDEKLYKKAESTGQKVAFITDKEIVTSAKNIKIFRLDSILQEEKIASQVAWEYVLQDLTILGDNPFKEKIEAIHLGAKLVLSEASDYWKKVLQNARVNHTRALDGRGLKNAFQNVPALIVGAGSSLDHALISSLKNKALIFAGGAALNEIQTAPDFAAALDANAPSSRFEKHPFKKAPFFFQARMNPENLKLMQGEKILFADSACDLINWIYNQNHFDAGWTVGNFLIAIARDLGCSPIYLTGMDFAYGEGKKYKSVEEEEASKLKFYEGYLTQRDWIMAAKWIEKKAKEWEIYRLSKKGILKIKDLDPAQLIHPERDFQSMIQEKLQILHPVQARWDEWDQALRQGSNERIVLEKLLEPLWAIFRPLFEHLIEEDPSQNLELHQKLFFQTVIHEHLSNS